MGTQFVYAILHVDTHATGIGSRQLYLDNMLYTPSVTKNMLYVS